MYGKRKGGTEQPMQRLRALLKAIMLRRKKNSEIDGKPILVLPKKTEEIRYAELSNDERDFYSQLEKKSQVIFNKYLRDGSIGKNYSCILVLLLRMRQACCHPHLNLDVDDGAPPVTNEDMIQLVQSLDKSIVTRIKDHEAFECPICYDAVPSPTFFVPCGHDSCKDCISRLVDNAATMSLQRGDENNRDAAKCPVCRGPFDPAKCFSYETFKQVHMPEMIQKEEDVKAESMDSDESATEYETDIDDDDDEVDNKGNLKDFIVPDSEDEDRKPKLTKKKKMKKKAKKTKKYSEKEDEAEASQVKPSMLKGLRANAGKNREANKKYWAYLRKTWLPSSKVNECMKLLEEINATGEKTIVFSQWTLLLDLLEVAMQKSELNAPKRYSGDMSATDRNCAAMAFRDRRDVKVLLVSLRAGNAGLNLTSASRVIIMDPFWNPYIEMQAIDRAYRIGQQREVKVYRILTKETVEDRIIELQEKKKEVIESALDEAESRKIGRLGTRELRFLFNGTADD